MNWIEVSKRNLSWVWLYPKSIETSKVKKRKEKKSIDTSLVPKNPYVEIEITALVNLVPHYMASFIIFQSVSFLRKSYTLPSSKAVQVWLVLPLDRYCVGILLMFFFFKFLIVVSFRLFYVRDWLKWRVILISSQPIRYVVFASFFCSFFYLKKKCLQSKQKSNSFA